MHAFEPIPILAKPGVAIRGHVRQQAEGRAAVGFAGGGLLASGILAEDHESDLVACVQERNRSLRLPGSGGDTAHFLGVFRVLRLHRLLPSQRFVEGLIDRQARGAETLQVGIQVVGYVGGKGATMHHAPLERIFADRQAWHAVAF